MSERMIAMGFKLDRVHVWSGEVADQAGGVAAKLSLLAQAGTNLEYIYTRRQSDQPGKGVLYVAPVTGPLQVRAARSAGLTETNDPVVLRVEGDNQAGLGHRVTQQWALAGLSFQGMSMAVINDKFVGYVSFDTVADANRAAAILGMKDRRAEEETKRERRLSFPLSPQVRGVSYKQSGPRCSRRRRERRRRDALRPTPGRGRAPACGSGNTGTPAGRKAADRCGRCRRRGRRPPDSRSSLAGRPARRWPARGSDCESRGPILPAVARCGRRRLRAAPCQPPSTWEARANTPIASGLPPERGSGRPAIVAQLPDKDWSAVRRREPGA